LKETFFFDAPFYAYFMHLRLSKKKRQEFSGIVSAEGTFSVTPLFLLLAVVCVEYPWAQSKIEKIDNSAGAVSPKGTFFYWPIPLLRLAT
jgi:hypothetical protein